MLIRPVQEADISLLAEFWYDQMALLSQKQSFISLMPDAIEQWQKHTLANMKDDKHYIFVIEQDDEVIGAIFGRIEDNQAGLLPQKYGVIDQLLLDLHSPHRRKNAVNNLLDALKNRFRQQDISHIIVHVSIYSLVEQGFWRGLGATQLSNSFWMEI